MQFYFLLQFRRFRRWTEKMGVPVILGLILIGVLFIAGSVYLFYKLDIAPWIYALIVLSLLFNLGEKQRNNQLKIIFNSVQYSKIRVLENGIIAIPFFAYLLYEQEFLIGTGLMLNAIILAFIPLNQSWSKVIPTPLRKLPFECLVGFRKTFMLFVLAYFVVFKAIQVNNYNLGIVTLGLVFLLMMSFYLKPEAKYFVWIYANKSTTFLKKKIVVAFISASILITPLLIALIIAFESNVIISVGVFLLGFVFLYSVILAKYSAYPNEIGVPQGILYTLSLWFPPLLLFVLPLFYKRSKQKLESILE